MSRLPNIDYRPNFKDSRVKARIEKVVNFVAPYLKDIPEVVNDEPLVGPHYFNADDLRTVFGSEQSSKFAGWLKANVLQQHDTYQVGHHPCSYYIRVNGLEKVLEQMHAATAGEGGSMRQDVSR